MLIPLSIINHFKPTRILPGEKQLHELYPLGTEQADLRLPRSEKFWTWRNFFLRLDDTFKFLQPLRSAYCGNVPWKQRSAGCSSGSEKGATVLPRFIPRC
jgi:hypothetical protein